MIIDLKVTLTGDIATAHTENDEDEKNSKDEIERLEDIIKVNTQIKKTEEGVLPGYEETLANIQATLKVLREKLPK